MRMENPDLPDLLDRMRNSAALQRSIGLVAGADLLEQGVAAIERLQPRVITTDEEAFALHDGAVVVNEPGRAFQITTRRGGPSDSIDHATAAWLLPLTVVHEGTR